MIDHDHSPGQTPAVAWRITERRGQIGHRRITLRADSYEAVSVIVTQRAYACVEVYGADGRPTAITRALVASAYAVVLSWSTRRAAVPPRVEVHAGPDLLVLRGADVVPALRAVYGDRVAAQLA